MRSNKTETLLVISPGFPASEADSTCIPPQQVFVKALSNSNPDLHIVVLALTYPFSSGQYVWNGIRVISCGSKNKGWLFRTASVLKMWLALNKLKREYNVIGLLSFWLGKCAYIADKFAKQNKLKHYCWLLGQDAKPGNKYVKSIHPNANSLIAISDFIATGLQANYGILPKHVIPVGIDTALFAPGNTIRDIDVLGAGSLIPLKQYAVFLEVIKGLKYFLPDIKAVICGYGPQMTMLKALVNNMDLEDNVMLTGELAHHQVLALMQRSKVLLHPSNYEGFSTVCLEALYAGAKVISFAQPMETDIPNWHTVANKEEMLNKLADILQDTGMGYSSVMPYRVQDSARAIAKLYAYNDSAIASN
jgi:glycosyltransferase involved in cell wall biosynthesis